MFKEKLKEYIDARVPIIYVNSYDDNAVEESIIEVTGRRKVWEWNQMYGLRNRKEIQKKGFQEIKEILESDVTIEGFLIDGVREKSFQRKVVILKDATSYLDNSQVVALLKNACLSIEAGELDTIFIIISPVLRIPKELEKYITILEEEYLTEEEIKTEIQDFIEENATGNIYEKVIDKMALAFKGLSALEINTILSLAFSRDGELTEDAMNLIVDQKKQMIQKSGILEMVPVKESLEDIGGLNSLKSWLRKKSAVLKDIKKAEAFGVELPKGVLIAGVPGCGKSLNAKASAKLFGFPLLKLDMGRLMGKYVGESEQNMRQAIALAEAISPCVLWIDELEKAFAGIGGSGGGAEVTTRLFGQFLTWMQEKKSAVFVVATANDIMKLPPELMRKGRFDEIFYVKMPTKFEREKIFEIHIRKRRPNDVNNVEIKELAEKTDGYSGADIEGVVKDAIESAFVNGKTGITTTDIDEAIQRTHSLQEIMGDSISKLEKEYQDRKFKSAS
ncbi:AAA family ATPase [Faecalicatena contorta]|uniref:AAA family ATPase n=1 Tax=Faecalicatena contorta TaxID=39482 RepID=UPI001F204D7E|nr:AAA family ATPase [Faecalicatena contorta]MCF2554377.1 AAA family ATPase [Faecalicatena contorta]